MDTVTCIHVRDWFDHMLRDDRAELPPAPIRAHLVSCSLCRGALALCVVALNGTDQLPALSCAACQDDLAAFIDHADRWEGALRRYPLVWWHLCLCDTCAETYELTRLLIQAEWRGKLAAPPRTVELELLTLTPLLEIPRRQLKLLQAELVPVRGSRRGSAGRGMVLAERQTANGQQVIVWAARQPDDTWRVSLTLTPAEQGWIVMCLGGSVFRSLLGPTGEAVVGGVPGELLTALDGPDLEIVLAS